MNYFLIDTDSVKAASLVNYNLNDEDLGYAIREAQNTYLREILGDTLLEKCVELASGGTLDASENEAYKELVDTYIFDYLVAETQVCTLVPITFKIRNIGVSQDSDSNITSQQLTTVKELRDYWETIATDKANRMKCFLRENYSAFEELTNSECVCGACKKTPNLKLEANVNLYLG